MVGGCDRSLMAEVSERRVLAYQEPGGTAVEVGKLMSDRETVV